MNGANGTNGIHATNGSSLNHETTLLYDNFVEIPIVGRVAAGQLTEAVQTAEDTVRIDRMLVGGAAANGGELFGLRVRGESMVNAGIRDGDYVFVRKQIDAHRGEIVVALVGEEATCKYYYPEPDSIRLVPANDRMTDIIISRDDWRSTQILGVVVGLYRKMN
jgi:repressor LexA